MTFVHHQELCYRAITFDLFSLLSFFHSMLHCNNNYYIMFVRQCNDCTKHKCLTQGFDYSREPWPTFTSSATVWVFILFQILAQEWNYINCVQGIEIPPSPFQIQPTLFCFCVWALNLVCPFLCLCLRFEASPPFCVLLILLAVARAPVVNKF